MSLLWNTRSPKNLTGVPCGLIHATNKAQTESDKELILDLVEDYMESCGRGRFRQDVLWRLDDAPEHALFE